MKLQKEDCIFALFILALLAVFFVQTCEYAGQQSPTTRTHNEHTTPTHSH